MYTTFFSAIANAILTAVAAFFIFGYIISLAFKGAAAFVLCCVASAAAALAVFALTRSRRERYSAAKTSEKDFSQRMYRLYLCTDNEIEELFRAVIDKVHICARVCGRHMRVSDRLTVVAPLYSAPMNSDGLLSVLRSCPYSGKYAVISSSFDESADKAAKTLGVKLVSTFAFAEYLFELGLLRAPEPPLKKPSFISRFTPFLYKSSGRKFLFYGAALCAMSAFVFYPVYYLIFGAVFVVYGLIAPFFGKKPIAKAKENFGDLLAKS